MKLHPKSLITLLVYIISMIYTDAYSQCVDLISVTFADGTPIYNGDRFLLSSLPSNLQLTANFTDTPGRVTFDVSGAAGASNFRVSAPYQSDSFFTNEGVYNVTIEFREGNGNDTPLCQTVNLTFEVVQATQISFDEDAVDWGINVDNGKDGGLAFGDFDNDGDLDLLVNTDDNSTRSRLYRNNGNNTFTDVTSLFAPYMLTTTRERAAVWGDLNNDGWLDFIRNTSHAGLEVYIQSAGGGVFGNGLGGATPLIFDDSNISDGVNTEGAGMLDFDGDGDLDIIFDNHNHGIDILRNNFINHINGTVINPPPSGLFTHATPGTGTSLGLAQTAIDGDYGSFTDVNDDGWVDIFMRKQGENDFFLNQGGIFTNGADLAEADNGNKGAVNLYDYDNDGDFDAYWTENGVNQIFRNDNGTWVALGGSTGIPTSHSGNSIDEVASGDIDNDGDIDILLVGDNRSEFYINQLNDPIGGRNTGSEMLFILDPTLSFHNGNDGEGASMVDIDNDGDLDIYINVENQENELYINDLYSSTTPEILKDYLYVRVLDDRSNYMQSGAERSALGATVVLEDCDGNVISGIRELNGGTGHGTQDPQVVHFGLVDGPDYSYRVRVKYPNWRNPANGMLERKEISKWIRPSQSVEYPITIEFRPSDSDILCPVEICGNGLDDDFDFKADCDDPDCGGYVDTDGDGVYEECPEDPGDPETFPPGSLVIPMDNDYQKSSGRFNLKAYGLIVRLLHAEIPLKWAIRRDKAKDGVDFTANASRLLPSASGSSSRDFRAGPILISPGFESQALSVINSFGNDVQVYELTESTTIDIKYTLTHKPKAALLNNGDNADIHEDIYIDAGMIEGVHYEDGISASSLNAGTCYTFASEPHTEPNEIDASIVDKVREFTQSGANFLAQCEGVEAYAHSSNGSLLSTFQSKPDIGGTIQYDNADEAYIQIHGDLADEGGSVESFTFTSNPGDRVAYDSDNGSNYKAYVGRVSGVTADQGGYIHYLAGHEYDGNNEEQINGKRLLLNALIRPAQRPDNCNLTFDPNTCKVALTNPHIMYFRRN